MILLFNSTPSVFPKRNAALFLFSFATALFTFLALIAAQFSVPFGGVKRQPQAVEEVESERRKAFDTAHGSDEDRQAYICASGHVSFVIAKAEAEAWQT